MHNRMKYLMAAISILPCLMCAGLVNAQVTVVGTTTYFRQNCTLLWDYVMPPPLDLAGFVAQASLGLIVKPPVTLPVTALQTSCAQLGIDKDGIWTFTVWAIDLAGNVSDKPFVVATRDLTSPTQPTNLRVTPNP